jgi:transcriptional regulator with XRE-family HTH domain
MKFGPHIREIREAESIGLRELARLIEVEPAYLSKIEREIFPPPSEMLIVKIAGHLGEDPDRLLALAGKIPSDVKDMIIQSEGQLAKLIREWMKPDNAQSSE